MEIQTHLRLSNLTAQESQRLGGEPPLRPEVQYPPSPHSHDIHLPSARIGRSENLLIQYEI